MFEGRRPDEEDRGAAKQPPGAVIGAAASKGGAATVRTVVNIQSSIFFTEVNCFLYRVLMSSH